METPLELVRRLRKVSKPLRDQLRRRVSPTRVQRTVRLAPGDWQPKRRRWHVLVDLVTEHCPDSGVLVAEVGTHTGYTAAHLLKYCPQIEKLYAIDLERADPSVDLLADLDRSELILGHSDECAKMFDDETFHLVFIDADHSEDAVLNDLRAWIPKVKRGGLITGHDYGSQKHTDVKAAVDSYFAGHPHPVRLEANKVWWTLK